jgi:hypothetical protein
MGDEVQRETNEEGRRQRGRKMIMEIDFWVIWKGKTILTCTAHNFRHVDGKKTWTTGAPFFSGTIVGGDNKLILVKSIHQFCN